MNYFRTLALALVLAGCAPTPAPIYLPSPVSTAAPTATAGPRLTVRLDIRDAVTGQPVKAEAWYSVDSGGDILIAEGISRAEADLPPGRVIVKVQADGYRLWWVQIQEWQRGERDQVLPIPVKLEPLTGTPGG